MLTDVEGGDDYKFQGTRLASEVGHDRILIMAVNILEVKRDDAYKIQLLHLGFMVD